jgi:hypothetical protein
MSIHAAASRPVFANCRRELSLLAFLGGRFPRGLDELGLDVLLLLETLTCLQVFYRRHILGSHASESVDYFGLGNAKHDLAIPERVGQRDTLAAALAGPNHKHLGSEGAGGA